MEKTFENENNIVAVQIPIDIFETYMNKKTNTMFIPNGEDDFWHIYIRIGLMEEYYKLFFIDLLDSYRESIENIPIAIDIGNKILLEPSKIYELNLAEKVSCFFNESQDLLFVNMSNDFIIDTILIDQVLSLDIEGELIIFSRIFLDFALLRNSNFKDSTFACKKDNNNKFIVMGLYYEPTIEESGEGIIVSP